MRRTTCSPTSIRRREPCSGRRDGTLYDRALVDPDFNNWSPRIGFAWQAMEKTVLRGGYGISYVHFNRLGGENLLAFNGPNIVGSEIAQQPSQGLCTGETLLSTVSG
jgi:hypothetical protein